MFSAKQNKNTGNIGEDIAEIFLRNKGFILLGRNINEPGVGEIDILARDPIGTLVFVEVKTVMDNGSGYAPENNLTRDKLKKLYRVCSMFSAKHQNLINESLGWRLDGVAITLGDVKEGEKLTDIYKSCLINYYENI